MAGNDLAEVIREHLLEQLVSSIVEIHEPEPSVSFFILNLLFLYHFENFSAYVGSIVKFTECNFLPCVLYVDILFSLSSSLLHLRSERNHRIVFVSFVFLHAFVRIFAVIDLELLNLISTIVTQCKVIFKFVDQVLHRIIILRDMNAKHRRDILEHLLSLPLLTNLLFKFNAFSKFDQSFFVVRSFTR